ncbi:HesA/MoeB/ThiF family protein [Myroides sp. NP-2]|uniref:HesA/MoeB/ThiF family protein n=1 Tax=Myroides sp. NP-2 TaxID=2759945 RepID=UPI0015FB6B74|nr:HesA/MoeB/ThiF family protein [Myroides sp. NP-2]MBB1150606.1 HesA/MoeB/ThiF family protein [Myroides sp. NP-2]
MLEVHDFMRYSRPMNITAVGVEGQLKIKEARVLVIGAGGLGSPILTYLAASGVGQLGVVDFDRVEIHNLHRQIVFTEGDIGQCKATIAAQRLSQLNPHICIRSHSQKLTEANVLQLVEHYDYVVDGTDNFATRYLVNDACVQLGKPLIYGTILGFQGQLAVFNHKQSKDLRAIFPEMPDPKDVPNCSLNGVLGTFPGIIGTMMAQETLKVIVDAQPLHNQLLLIDTLNWNLRVLTF